MNFPKRGEIYLISLNPVIGSEIGKSRPGLVISNNRNNEFAETVTIIPITSKTSKIYPFEVFIPEGAGGLAKDSKAKCDQIRTISKRRLIKYLGTLEELYLKEIEKATLIHLGIKHS
jgi:mRNA interferase MazF